MRMRNGNLLRLAMRGEGLEQRRRGWFVQSLKRGGGVLTASAFGDTSSDRAGGFV